MYQLPGQAITQFNEQGYAVLPGFVSSEELGLLQDSFEALISGALPCPGKDRGEHTPGLLNVTAFTLYHPLESIGQGVLAALDQRGLDVTRRLYGEDSSLSEPTAFARDCALCHACRWLHTNVLT